jgi:predicted transcriptional regulator
MQVPTSRPFLTQGAETNLGQLVEDECRELGISVTRVANEARISRATIFRWKRGDYSPQIDTWRRVASILDGYWARRTPLRREGA